MSKPSPKDAASASRATDATAGGDELLGDELLGEQDQDTLAVGDGELDSTVPADLAKATGRGLLHLALVCAVLGVGLAIPYVTPTLRSWRAWLAEDGVPVARLFAPDRETVSAMAVATGGSVASEATDARLAETLGADVAANLLEGDDAPAPEPEPLADGETGPAVRIAPSELEGLVLELEDEGGRAMRAFYEQLVRTADDEPGAITRVAHYGDSTIAGDGITSTMRRRLQQRFGDAGHGFVLIARGTMPYRHQDLSHRASDNWRLIQLVRSGLSDRQYGYGGVQYRAGFGTTATFGTSERGPVGGAVSRFELWYQSHPRGGRVDVQIDDGERAVFETRSETQTDAWHVVEVPDGAHELEVRTMGGGESRLYGMVMEREGPGVVYDSLGMVGARARRMLGYDPEHFRRQHQHRETNLIVIAFGGNDADDRRTPAQFEDDFRQVAHLARTGRPEASCLVMAPLDQAHRNERGAIVTMPQIPIIVEAARAAARAEGCAYFDTYTAMGGEGSMRSWSRSTPRLAGGDGRHAAPAGYQVIGNMFYKAILKGFADFLARR